MNLSVPPGFASLTSFFLKRDDKVTKTDKSDPIQIETNPEIDDTSSYNQIYMQRPWIILDQSKRKPEESHTEHLPVVKSVICSFFIND
jgi:histone demethylase JARID1